MKLASIITFTVAACALAMANALCAQAPVAYENPADYPLMGDWEGEWLNPKGYPVEPHPAIAAQLLPVNGGSHYRVVILEKTYSRAAPYLDVVVPATHERVEVKEKNFEVVFEGAEVRGRGNLNKWHDFVLKKVPLDSPTVGTRPPEGSAMLFDGKNFNAWRHKGGRDVTWHIMDDAMQVAPSAIRENREKGIGGDIETRKEYGSMRFHMEFRYPVEAGKKDQGRGNSGLFFDPLGEIQILNSYTTPNYWNECGAIYRRAPAKVGAAGPPLEWQAYDVWLHLPEGDETAARFTVHLNGRVLHHETPLLTDARKVRIRLQDHTNPIEFRNIWLIETNP